MVDERPSEGSNGMRAVVCTDPVIELNHLTYYAVVYESWAVHVDGPVVEQVVGQVVDLVEALDGDEQEDPQFHEKIINQFEHNCCHLDIPNFVRSGLYFDHWHLNQD